MNNLHQFESVEKSISFGAVGQVFYRFKFDPVKTIYGICLFGGQTIDFLLDDKSVIILYFVKLKNKKNEKDNSSINDSLVNSPVQGF